MQKTNKKITFKKSYIVWTFFMISFFILLYFLNSSLKFNQPEDAPIGIVYEKAVVTKITSDTLSPDPDYPYIDIGKQYLEIKITTGENKGKIVSTINFVGRTDNKPVKVGTKLVISSYDDFISTIIVNYNREVSIYILLFIFIFVVLFLGKLKGAKSLFSLVFTMICIFFVFIPLIIRGINPIASSIIIVILSTMVTMISLNGVTKKTFVASLSCILCTIIAGLIAYIFGKFNNISTFNTAEVQDLLFVSTKTSLKVKDLLFAGILISSLGAIMDTTMSITSSIFEIKDVNNNLSKSQLFISGMNIGKDIMGTMTNTLILAFTGSSINILIIYFMYCMPYIQLINIDLIVLEIVQGLSGGIAVILSIPITAFAASELIGYKKAI
ncbi:YibE/F family protein [Romboutsia ilealis]|uniref:YibE/F family protein n=1 Tax=Romboutsia faecis TaxID=2764597 RepID=A0ABR7JN13_9FIRM|nr:YibE/F family protein [Romboutsia faecis]MBC5996157.1 YibE/F family protein [Romboutsia faecis]MRN23357.1 YibE/F family protein [Romboutsia ilealis]